MDREGAGRGGWVDQELVPAEAGIALATVRVEDPERGPTPRRTEPVAGDERVRPLADDVATEPDPVAPAELEAQAGCLRHGRREAAVRSSGRIERHEQRVRPTGEGRQAV